MAQTEVITIKVSAELKNNMKKVGINWSEYIRDCVQKRVDEQKMRAASKRLDEIRKHTKPTSTDEIVAWIREDRER